MSKKEEKKPKLPELIGKVQSGKVKLDLVVQALVDGKAVKSAAAKSLTIVEAVKALTAHYEKTDKDNLADCEECGGASPLALEACPFCGTEGIEADPSEDETETETDETDEEEEVAAEEDPESIDIKKPAPKKGAIVAAAPKAALVKKEPVKPEDIIPAGVTTEKLDAAIADFVMKKRSGAGSMWDLGKSAMSIYDGQLWKARIVKTEAEDKTVTVKPMYRSWNEFCTKELGMTPANVYGLMDVARAFTRDNAVEFGTTKLGLILKAPEDAQPALLEAAKTHGKRALAAKVDEEKKKAGKTGKRETGRKKMPEGKGGGRAKKAKGKGNDAITIATLVDKKLTVPLYKRPGKGEQPTERAEKLDDQPIGWKELENKVNILFRLSADSTGKLQVTLQFKAIEREEEEEGEESEAEAAE